MGRGLSGLAKLRTGKRSATKGIYTALVFIVFIAVALHLAVALQVAGAVANAVAMAISIE